MKEMYENCIYRFKGKSCEDCPLKCNGKECEINSIDAEELDLKGFLIPITECKYFDGIGDCKETKGLCVDNDNCYFKQLQRIKQINFELISKANAYDKLVILANDRLGIIDRLKQENEELKAKRIKSLGFICDCEENAKFRQALEEIREIAQIHQYFNPELLEIKGDIGQMQDLKMTEIFKKCNEVLNDRDRKII